MNNVMVETFENFAVLRSPSAFVWFTDNVTIWQIHFMGYSPTSLLCGTANSWAGSLSDMSLKSRVGSFENYKLRISTLNGRKGISQKGYIPIKYWRGCGLQVRLSGATL